MFSVLFQHSNFWSKMDYPDGDDRRAPVPQSIRRFNKQRKGPSQQEMAARSALRLKLMNEAMAKKAEAEEQQRKADEEEEKKREEERKRVEEKGKKKPDDDKEEELDN